MRGSWVLATLAAAGALALGGCSKEIDSASAPRATGSEATGAASGQLAARPGIGLDGGLGNTQADGAKAMGAGPIPEGSANRTTKSSVGNRD